MSFKIDISSVLKGLAEGEIKTRAAVGLYCDSAGKKLEATAKKEAPWTDRTALARQTIQGGKEWKGNKCNVFVSGNTNYFKFLEFAHEKRYAILYPTVKKMQNEIISGMRGILK